MFNFQTNFKKFVYLVDMNRYLPLFEMILVICEHVFCQILTSLFNTSKGVARFTNPKIGLIFKLSVFVI